MSISQASSHQNTLFPNQIPLTADQRFKSLFDSVQYTQHNLAYTHNNRVYHLIPQPRAQKAEQKSCGAGALLMLYLSVLTAEKKLAAPSIAYNLLSKNKLFWITIKSCSMERASGLVIDLNQNLKMNELQLEAKTKSYQKEGISDSESEYEDDLEDFELFLMNNADHYNPKPVKEPSDQKLAINGRENARIIQDVKSKIDTSGHPVILAITHPVIQGHWIVVDSINLKADEIRIRDPYTSLAYCISKNDLSSYLPLDSVEINLVYLKKTQRL